MNSPNTSNRARKPVLSTRLSLQALEDRCTPATAAYAALTQTLTVNAAEGDFIQVAQIASQPTGFIQVNDGSTVFDSSAHVQPVRNLIVRFNGVNNGGLSLLAKLRLAGNVTVIGAKKTQSLASFAAIGGNFTYTATADANDTLTFFDATRVGGNMRLNLGAGHNTVSLRGGAIGGRLAVTGAAGADHIELCENSDLRIGGSASFSLGNGLNEVMGIGKHEFAIGQSLTVKGGVDFDVFDMGDSSSQGPQTTLRVGGNFVASLGAAHTDSPDPSGNEVRLNLADIGGNLDYTGGPDYDLIRLHDLTLGGDLRASMGDGASSISLNFGSSYPVGESIIGGNFYYTASGWDATVEVIATTVHKNVNINVVNGALLDFVIGAYVELGYAGNPLTVNGSLTIASGDAVDAVFLANVSVDHSITVETGSGDDQVTIDDVSVAGQTSINLGAGIDYLAVETRPGNSVAPLDDISTFGGEFRVIAGSGDDEVNLSDDLDATTRAHFGGKVTLKGAGGIDTLKNVGNLFSVTGNLEDFELGASLP